MDNDVKKQDTQIGKCTEDWHLMKTDVYNARIYMYIGTRENMVKTAYDAFSSGPDPIEESEAKSFANALKEECSNNAGIDGNGITLENDRGSAIWVIRMDSFDGSIDHTALLNHECLHVALFILLRCGVRENPPFEALCYLNEAIFKNFMMFCFKSIGQLRYK